MASTGLSSGAVPAYYREVYEKLCSPSSGNVDREVFKELLVKSKLSQTVLSQIWELVDCKSGQLTRNGLYKALALVALAQQGKTPSEKLLENAESEVLPVPALEDLTDVTTLAQSLYEPSKLKLTYTDICNIDTIEINLVPEKKGIIIKHTEYQITSKRFGSMVYRRYNDFVAFHDLLLARFPYRLIPKLPPKKMGAETPQFLEERRRCLQRYLTLVARHPVVSQDQIVNFFFTYSGEDILSRIKDMSRSIPDEFATSALSSRTKELVPPETLTEFGLARDQLKEILAGVTNLKRVVDGLASITNNYADEMANLGLHLTNLASESHNSSWATGGSTLWHDMKKSFHEISKEFGQLSLTAREQSNLEKTKVCERLNLLLDLLIAHKTLTERQDRGVISEHKRAVSTMLTLKTKQMQGALKGTDAGQVASLEDRMVAQESVIKNVELRGQFSLFCLHMETQLIHAHLEILASVLQSLVKVQIRGHSELADVWKSIEPTIMMCLPEKSSEGSNGIC